MSSLSCFAPELVEQYRKALSYRAGPCSVKELVAGLEALIIVLRDLMQRDAMWFDAV